MCISGQFIGIYSHAKTSLQLLHLLPLPQPYPSVLLILTSAELLWTGTARSLPPNELPLSIFQSLDDFRVSACKGLDCKRMRFTAAVPLFHE